MENTNGEQVCFAVTQEGSVNEAENISHITNIDGEQSLSHYECLMSHNVNNSFFNNITASINDALHGQRLNVGEITNYDVVNTDIELAQNLRVWAVKRNITLNALSELLAILSRYNYKNLPRRSQTLLRSPRNTSLLIRELEGGGQFWYHSILSGLESKYIFVFYY